jgi:hypothetical protein
MLAETENATRTSGFLTGSCSNIVNVFPSNVISILATSDATNGRKSLLVAFNSNSPRITRFNITLCAGSLVPCAVLDEIPQRYVHSIFDDCLIRGIGVGACTGESKITHEKYGMPRCRRTPGHAVRFPFLCGLQPFSERRDVADW